MAELLTDSERETALDSLDGWYDSAGTSISKKFKFRTFTEAFAFMVKIATIADKMNHHPDWTNIYNKVDVTLSTHDKGGVTKLDIDLAGEMDKAAS
ncbi:MAG: 4a-hydroxytetrahydrobiopterin dehydratase [Rhizobiaceae bacterium]